VDDHAFLSDTGESLYEVEAKNHKSYDTGQRVLLTYSYSEKTAASYDRAIFVHSSSSIALGELKPLDQKEIDRLPNDPVRLESVWIGSHYLNLRFYMDYKSETHGVKLVCDPNEPNKIYFRHDNNNDPPGYPVFILISFDLSKVLDKPQGDRSLYINLNTNNYGNKTYELKY
jgi:hypothetical protein